MNTNTSLLQGERMAHAIVEEAKQARVKRGNEAHIEAEAVKN